MGRSVAYPSGYPDFAAAGYVVENVNVNGFKNRWVDKRTAEKELKKAGIDTDREKQVLHHAEDLCTMQLMCRAIHEQFTHQGGYAKAKGGR